MINAPHNRLVKDCSRLTRSSWCSY